jgi:hypothetical protein
MSGDLLAVLAPTHVVSVIDLVTSQTVELPQRAANRNSLLTWGNRLGVLTGMSGRTRWQFTYWDVSVPREPAELQRWLATITNARSIPGSDAIAWPAN